MIPAVEPFTSLIWYLYVPAASRVNSSKVTVPLAPFVLVCKTFDVFPSINWNENSSTLSSRPDNVLFAFNATLTIGFT